MEIPELDPDREDLAIKTINTESYRVIPTPVGERPTHAHTARRLVAANARLQEFSLEAERRIQPNSGSVRVRYTLESGQRAPSTNLDWADVALPVEVASELSPIASEVVHHLRTALEYIVFNMVWEDTGTRPTYWVKAPCHGTEDEWSRSMKSKPLRLLSSDHLSALGAVQPFTGTPWLTHLTSLSNPDKHHSPIQVFPGIEFQIPKEMVLGQWQEVQTTTRFMAKVGEEQLDYIETIHDILRGLINLANPLLVEEGEHPIVISRRRHDDAV